MTQSCQLATDRCSIGIQASFRAVRLAKTFIQGRVVLKTELHYISHPTHADPSLVGYLMDIDALLSCNLDQF